MSAYKIRITGAPRGIVAAESDNYQRAETIARLLSAEDAGHYWVTTVTLEPLTSFTGGQRDHQATAQPEIA